MALDELHARRLATVITVVEGALERIELVLAGIERPGKSASTESRYRAEQIREMRQAMASARARLTKALERFAVERTTPEPRQVLAAELSALWVVLENARPNRMKGYGRQFDPQDKNDWEQLIENLLRDVEQIRRIAVAKGTED